MIFHHCFPLCFVLKQQLVSILNISPKNGFGFVFHSHFIVPGPDCPLSAVLASAADSALLRMHFVNRQAVPADDCQTPHAAELHLLILCKNGAMLIATTGRGLEPSAALLSER